jgi:uncharacterized protein (DUF1330 family)
MAAYFIVDIEIKDADGMQEYRDAVPATIQKYGGRYLVRAGKWEALEGSWRPKRVVVLEFPSVEQAKRWYDSEEYRRLKTQRQAASSSNVVLVEGLQA